MMTLYGFLVVLRMPARGMLRHEQISYLTRRGVPADHIAAVTK